MKNLSVSNMTEKTIIKSIRLTPAEIEFVEENNKNLTVGIKRYIKEAQLNSDDKEMLNAIRKSAFHEIKDVFNRNEWFFFSSVLNGMDVPNFLRLNPSVLAVSCEDAEKYEYKARLQGVDLDSIVKKINRLTSAQVETIYTEIENFFSCEADADKWLAQFKE